MTKKEAGVYRAVVADSRGEDESILELADNGEKLKIPPQNTEQNFLR